MIVAFRQHPEKSGLLILFVDDEPFCDLSTVIYGKKPSLPKEVTSIHVLEERLLEIERQGAKRYLFNKLSQRSYHSSEIKNFLKKRLVSEDTIDRLLKECQGYGYVDDKLWIHHYIDSERNKKRGNQWIERKMRQKGIPQEDVILALEEHNDEEETRNQIHRLLETRYRTRNLSDYRDREKTIAALLRRGYEFDLVRDVIRKKDS